MNELNRLKRIKEAMLNIRLSQLNSRQQKADYQLALKDVMFLIEQEKSKAVTGETS
jgi:hypothetical protein